MSNHRNNRQPSPVLEWRELAWNDAIAPEHISAMLERLATAPEFGTLILEFRASDDGARWLLGSQPHRFPALKDAFTSHLPVKLTTPRRVRTPMTLAAHLKVSGRQPLSAKPNKVSAAVRALYGAVSRLQEKERVTVQVILGRRLSPGYWNRDPVPTWFELLLGKPVQKRRAKQVEAAETHGFMTHIRIGAAGEPARTRFLIRQMFGALRAVETSEAHLHLHLENANKLGTVSLPWRWPLALRSSELCAFTGWPGSEPPLPLIGSIHPRVLAPTTELVESERVIGVATAPGHEQRVSIPIRDAAFHTHLLGPTGSGKSTTMLSLIEADMKAGRGVFLLDPKGDLASDVLARVPRNRQSDVVIFDPTHPSPVGFNPLAGSASMAPVTADTLLSIFEAKFKENWGIRTADVLSAAFLSLARIDTANLLWLNPLLTDPAFRKKVIKGMSDPLGTDNFWRQYDAKKPEAQASEIAPVLNKLRQLTLRPGLRAILGQSQPRFDMNDLFSQKRIVIVNLNRGLLGNESANLLGTLLLGQLWNRILARQKAPQERRHIVSIYIDEVHDFLAGLPTDLSDALAQARSLGAAFILAHQYRSQLTPTMQQAVDANTRNTIIFGLNGSDAVATAKHTPGLEAQDFMLLPKYHAYANVMQNGENSGWISIATRPPSAAINDVVDVYAASHERYGVDAKETEREILKLIDIGAADDAPSTGQVGRVKR